MLKLSVLCPLFKIRPLENSTEQFAHDSIREQEHFAHSLSVDGIPRKLYVGREVTFYFRAVDTLSDVILTHDNNNAAAKSG